MKIKRINSTSATEITKSDGTVVLVSYSTPVAACLADGSGFYRTSEYYSRTTSKQINQWLGSKKESAQVKPQSFFDALL